ncbi:MAG: molybdopterin converting factor subunit 1 [Rhodospirillales bacterium]|nr:molybdopterin converting factor subunit 1 [Rhodospirillales bacterium]
MRILYFAWVREKTGIDMEDVQPPANVADLTDLVEWLRSRGDGFEEALGDASRVRAAVNQEAVKLDHPVGPDDEVAFFPPVTGG